MTKRWMTVYLAVFAAGSLGCFYGWGEPYEADDYSYEYDYEDDDYSYSSSYDYPTEQDFYDSASYGDGYHGRNAVRQALTAEAPEVDNDGYAEDWNAWGECEVHAQCPAGQVCASDPWCPDYLYCYDIAEAECDCADRFNTVCYFGKCIERGVDCDDGCPAGTECIEEVGACAHTEEATIDAPDEGEKCLADADCPQGSCVDGECRVATCGVDADCGSSQICALAANGQRYCVIP